MTPTDIQSTLTRELPDLRWLVEPTASIPTVTAKVTPEKTVTLTQAETIEITMQIGSYIWSRWIEERSLNACIHWITQNIEWLKQAKTLSEVNAPKRPRR